MYTDPGHEAMTSIFEALCLYYPSCPMEVIMAKTY